MAVRIHRTVSQAFLFAGLAAFAAFHFLPAYSGGLHQPDRGWQLWVDIWDFVQTPSMIDAQGGIALGAVLGSTLLITSSPFLGRVWRRSRLARLGCLAFGSISTAAFLGLVSFQGFQYVSSSEISYLAAVIFNFLGLLFINLEARPPDTAPVMPGDNPGGGNT